MLKLIRNFNSQSIRKCSSYKAVSRAPRKRATTNVLGQKFQEFSLAKQIEAKIKLAGPITVSSYMKEVLTNPNSGYYMTKDVFGHDGDFVTSPELTQIFNELIGIWMISEWRKIGSLAAEVQLIELGPGRCSLMQDLIRVLDRFRVLDKVSIHLVELSPYLSQLQAQRIGASSQELPENSEEKYYRYGETLSGVKVFWYRRLQDVPNNFSIVVANEFLDALPIHKFQKDSNGKWKEVLIDIDGSAEKDQTKFRYIISRNETPTSKLFAMNCHNESRDHVEVSFESDVIVQHIAERLESYGGFGLLIDYGHSGDKTDTFRAFKKHQLHDPLIEPGTADLTADVDFKRIKSICEKDDRLITFGPLEQGTFLKNMEINCRMEAVLKNCNEEQQEIIKSACDMLISPEKMGSRFKFFAMFPSVLKEHLAKFPVMGFE